MTNTKQVFLNFKENLLKLGESKEYVILIGLNNDYRPVFDHVEIVGEVERINYRPELFFKKLSDNGCKRCVLIFSHKSNTLKATKKDRILIANVRLLADLYEVMILDNIIIKADLTSYNSIL